MTNTEKVKQIRDITMSPFKNINTALIQADGDVDKAIEILVAQKQADTTDMANRVANNSIVYSYVHNNKIGAMIVLSCQTDFVARNEVFLGLAKDLCIHIVSAPQVNYISEKNLNPQDVEEAKAEFARGMEKKPQAIINKIVEGKWQKRLEEMCLLNQKFVKDDSITVQQLISGVSSTVGEKIELKKFVRLSTAINV